MDKILAKCGRKQLIAGAFILPLIIFILTNIPIIFGPKMAIWAQILMFLVALFLLRILFKLVDHL
jgi:hypothetical protein